MGEDQKSFYAGLVEVIVDAIMTDDESDNSKEVKMYCFYMERNSYEKELIDNMFIHLCGYSFDTLLNNKMINL